MKKMLVGAIAAAVVTLGGSAFTSPDRTIPFPADYRHWTHVKSTLVGPQHPSFEANGGYHHFYANDEAMDGFRSGTFPDGSVLIDDGLEAVERDGVTTEGSRRRVAVMVKDGRRFSDTQNWGFEMFPRDSREGALSAPEKAACLACHQRAERDLVYSRFRK